jgi:energy-coupling factor transport system permease protein
MVAMLFFALIKPEQLGDALLCLKLPYPMVFVLITALRYIPLLRQKISRIRESQLARGIDLRPRWRNWPNLTALLVPLLVQSFILSDQLAIAMEIRGFGQRQRSLRHAYRLRGIDLIVMLSALGGLVCFYWWERLVV